MHTLVIEMALFVADFAAWVDAMLFVLSNVLFGLCDEVGGD